MLADSFRNPSMTVKLQKLTVINPMRLHNSALQPMSPQLKSSRTVQRDFMTKLRLALVSKTARLVTVLRKIPSPSSLLDGETDFVTITGSAGNHKKSPTGPYD